MTTNGQTIRDLISFYQSEASIPGLKTETLGKSASWPILLLSPVSPRQSLPRVLIAAGFHGEETAGVLGIKLFIEAYYRKFQAKANISFLPLVNPDGFSRNNRYNRFGGNANNGYIHSPKIAGYLSLEGKVLKNHAHELIELAHDGFLSLHEEIDFSNTYLYTFEKRTSPGEFSQTLRSTLEKNFPLFKGANTSNEEVKKGIVFKSHDGSFEDYLFHQGVPLTACTETPGLCPLDKRVRANAELICTFVEFVSKKI